MGSIPGPSERQSNSQALDMILRVSKLQAELNTLRQDLLNKFGISNWLIEENLKDATITIAIRDEEKNVTSTLEL